MDPMMGRFATRIMLQAHRQEILLVYLPLSRVQDRKTLRPYARHVHLTNHKCIVSMLTLSPDLQHAYKHANSKAISLCWKDTLHLC